LPRNIQSSSVLLFFACVSVFGSFAAVLLALNPPQTQGNILWRKPLVGSLFASVCILGIIAIFLPGRCSEISHSQEKEKEKDFELKPSDSQSTSIRFRGHHADCGGFSSHLIRFDERVLCAACTGLFLGSIASIIGAVAYFFGGWGFAIADSLAILAGQVGISVGFAQFKFEGYARLLVNALFVLSAFVTIVGADELAKSLLIDLYLIAIIVFWIWTRILISQWDHARICSACKLSCRLKEK